MLLDGDFGEMTPGQIKAISDSYSSGQQMAVTVGDFLDMSRIQAGHFIITKESVNVVELLKSQIKQLGAIAKSRDIKLVSDIDSTIPEIDIDREKMSQVTMNFIDNAIRYSASGSTVEVSLKKDKNDIVFKVKDSGIGVPESEQANLFKKFYRATNAKQTRPNGNGVGLYVAKKIITAHHGQVIFESKPGKGSVFGFRVAI